MRSLVPLLVCLLLTPGVFAAEAKSKPKPEPNADALNKRAKDLDAREADLNKQAEQLKAQKTALDKEQANLETSKKTLPADPEGEAEAIVEGPDEASRGTLVVLDASGSKAAAFMWIADGLTPDQYSIDSSGKRLYFATPCEDGLYKFVLSVALDNTVDALIHSVSVGEGPTPPPPPPPLIGFAKEVYDWANEVVPKEVLKTPAAAFEKNYDTIVAQIEAGTLKELEKIDWEITKLNRAAVNEDVRKQWLPWFEKLKERFDKLEKDGKLKTPQDVSKLFQDIAKALKELK